MDDLTKYLINYAFDHGIGVVLTNQLPAELPSAASFQRRKVLINMNWQPKTEIPFIMAHEIAHVLNGDDGTRYYESATIHSKVEYQANLTAVEILLNYCHNLDIEASNPVHLCENFGIPTALEYVVREQVQTYHVSRHRKAQIS